MNLPSIKLSQALELLEEEAVLVTSSRRLSRHLSMLFSKSQQEKNRVVWKTPAIKPFDAWLEQCFFSMDRDAENPYLLSREQEQSLWEDIILSTSTEHRFPDLKGISRTAADAWELMVRYKLPWREIEYSQDIEISSFFRWAGLFSRKCSEQGFLTNSELTVFMTQVLGKALITCPKTLILAGFLEFDPVQGDFLTTMAKSNARICFLNNGLPEGQAVKTGLNEFKEEVTAAARWSLNLVQNNPETRVGIAVPGLENHRSMLIRIFDQVFHPETIFNFEEPENRIFNVSLGRPLGDYSLVRSAIVFLDFIRQEKWSIRDLGVILGSPFIVGGLEEFPSRAALEEMIRHGNQPWRPAAIVMEIAARQGESCYCPVLLHMLGQAREIVFSQEKLQSPSRWAALFARLLETAGWPGSRELNSFEYQTFQAFNEELSSLYRLEAVLGKIAYSKALEKLNSLLKSRVFQPESAQAPVQILGLFETAGLDFDHLWVMNLTSDVLPCPCKPNPLLPLELQRKRLTPGSSPRGELDLAVKIMNSLLSSSKEIIFSYSAHEDDRELMESPLIEDILPVDFQEGIEQNQSLNIVELVSRNPDLTALSDDYGLPFEESWLSGGARAFQDQALCPFKGYAAHRLDARAPEEPEFALTPIDRGNLVHKALMLVWQELGTLEELKEMMRQDNLDALLDEAALLTVQEFKNTGHVLFTPEFMELEAIRLKSIILKWLEKELERLDFQVSALEKTEYFSINGIKIKTRMDRVDRLENGSMVIIDYKTGSSIDNVENMWMGDRIIEPQLPIYSQILGEKASGVILAQVNPRAFKFHGLISGNEIRFKNNRLKTPQDLDLSGMKEILDQWFFKLEKISQEIKQGLATADPFPQPNDKTCRYCSFMPLCRIKQGHGLD
jgi:ATP-dependent helicase/nuclease subunit B